MEDRKRYFIETFGCQMNVNDSEKVAGLLQRDGYEEARRPEDADFVFINTCAVREKAAEKLFSALGRLKHLKSENPDLRIGVGGCVAQLQGTSILERAPQVDVLVGTHNLARIPELIERSQRGFKDCIDLDRQADTFTIPDDAVAHSKRVRAYVTAIEGCNHVCSFCVVPRTRGPEICRPADQIVGEVEALVRRGYPEVMLLGQTVNAYRHRDTDFPALLTRVHEVPGLRRLRFTTSHPDHVTPAMARAFRELPRLQPYLHLPVQSGSDRVLSGMRRGYSRGQYLEVVARLRAERPDLALTSDIIVGYPGESESDFEETLRLIDEVGFDGLFVFTYSPRPGTTAVRETDDVPAAEKSRRLQIVNHHQQRRQERLNRERIGSIQEVLVETAEGARVSGRTPHFRIVHFDGSADLLGREVAVEIVHSGPNSLVGRIVSSFDGSDMIDSHLRLPAV